MNGWINSYTRRGQYEYNKENKNPETWFQKWADRIKRDMEQIREKQRSELPEFIAGEVSAPHQHVHPGTAHTMERGDTTGPRLLITLVINLLIPAAQVIGGIYSHSVALIPAARLCVSCQLCRRLDATSPVKNVLPRQ